MDLKHVKGIGPAKQAKLETAGIRSVEELAHCDVQAVATATGLGVDLVRDLRARAAAVSLLQDVKGMGPASVQVLAEQGIQSLKDLYQASTDLLAKELKVARNKVQDLQREAEVLARRVAEESKTPEGRRALATEAKAAAKKGAAKAQKTGQDLMAKAREEGEMVMMKAKEFQKNAPSYLEETRVKAEAIVKDAEQKLRALTEKTQAAVKAEVEKVKAANQGLVMRTKARINKAK